MKTISKNTKSSVVGTVILAALLPSALFGLDVNEDVNVDGTVTIQTAPTDAAFGINDDGLGVNPAIPEDLGTLINPVADTTPVYTQLGGATISEEDFDNSGIIAETNGNLTLLSNQGQEETFAYTRAVRNDVYNADQPLAGQSAQFVNIGGYVDPDTGVFVELGLLDLAENWDPAFVGTALEGELILDPTIADSLTPEQEALLVSVSDIPGDGGNLLVSGDATVLGTLSAGGVADVEGTLNTHFGLVSANIAAIADEAAVRATADDEISAGYIAADAELAAGIAANNDTLSVHYGLVSKNIGDIDLNKTAIADEAAARAAADDEIVAGYQAADSAIVAGYQAADAELAAGIAANNDTLSAHYALVSKNIGDIADNKESIERNARGISMVAALTHSTILPGMENALDINAAYFEDELGLAISYSRRVNENTQINFGAASTSDFEESVVRGGVSFQW
ncbi:hypothetical protein G0Q06_06485 [Puniceicoccales bacterium CK1056]|uniref:Trimeric autotransporter adhesin YadA-like C-terminal membrane anchor domain-containing protein n=1 Tax=Oceanipulchritudo coccoides TaxID=2706888 RepID=A0A6B2LZJ7_9BACT|nr:YadA-like family protein [Oceanipulchritudo coccoides]NDV62088.1 hypothetical protein [Oceanipulchritudo coccoides]